MNWEEKIMKSRISFFSGAIYKKDLTRFWPIWTIEMVLLLFYVVFPVYSSMDAYRKTETGYGRYSPSGVVVDLIQVHGSALTNGVVIAVACLVVALFLFSYLYKTREAYNAHFLPMKRETLFFSHYLAGLTMLVIPFVITYGLLVCIENSYFAGITLELFREMTITLVEIVFFFNLACCITMLTANGIMTTMIYTVSNVLYQGVVAMFVFMASLCIYGYQGGEELFANSLGKLLTPIAFFSGEDSVVDMLFDLTSSAGYINDSGMGDMYFREGQQLWQGPEWTQALWYLIPAVLFLGLSVILYKKRSLETAGNMLAFSWGKPLFRIVFTVCGSMVFTLVLYMICIQLTQMKLSYKMLFPIFLGLTIVGSVLAYLISNMILSKSFFIWKKTSYWRMLLLTGMLVAAMSYMKYGYGDRIPEENKVDYVRINFQEGKIHTQNSYYIQGEEQIQRFQKLHKEILQYGNENEEIIHSYGSQIQHLEVLYSMKNGEKFSRSFPIFWGDREKLGIPDFINEKESMITKAFTEAYEDIRIFQVVYLMDDGTELERYGNYELPQRFYQAVLKDMEEGNVIFLGEDENTLHSYLDIKFKIPKEIGLEKYKFSEEFIEEVNGEVIGIKIPLNWECKNVRKVMEDLGI